MVKLQLGKRTGNYIHIFANRCLGQLITDTHSAMIKMGTALEKTVLEECGNAGILIKDFDEFIDNCNSDNGIEKYEGKVMLLSKKIAKKSRKLRAKKAEPDFIVFLTSTRECKVIELKLGMNFDTKKAQGEVESLSEIKNMLGTLMSFTVKDYVCSFMAKTHDEIVTGFKGRIDVKQAMTGQEFCELLRLNYDEILNRFKNDATYNKKEFVRRILDIPELCKMVREQIEK